MPISGMVRINVTMNCMGMYIPLVFREGELFFLLFAILLSLHLVTLLLWCVIITWVGVPYGKVLREYIGIFSNRS